MHRGVRNGSAFSWWRGSECSQWGLEAALENPRSPKGRGLHLCCTENLSGDAGHTPSPQPRAHPTEVFSAVLILFSFSAKEDLSELLLSEICFVSMSNVALGMYLY